MKNSTAAIMATLSAMASSLLTLYLQTPAAQPTGADATPQQHIQTLEQEQLHARTSISASPPTHPSIASATPMVAAPSSAAAVDVVALAGAIESLQKNDRFNNWLRNRIATSTGFNLATEMQKRFNAEAVDTYWAAEEEANLRTIFSTYSEFSGNALKDAQCRTSQCQLSIGITDIEQANELVAKVSSALRANNPNIIVIATPDPQRGVTTLYLSKDADSFQFN